MASENSTSIIFDLDGTILDVRRRYCTIYQDLLRERSRPALSDERYWELRRERTPIRQILEEIGEGDYAETFSEEHLRRIEDRRYLEFDCIMPGMLNVLDFLAPRVSLVLATLRRCSDHLDWQLDRLGILPYFSRILTRPGVGDASLEKQQLIESLPQASSISLMIGDTEADIRAGQALRIPTCAVAYGIRSEAYLRSLRPNYVARSPSEILSVVGQVSQPASLGDEMSGRLETCPTDCGD